MEDIRQYEKDMHEKTNEKIGMTEISAPSAAATANDDNSTLASNVPADSTPV